LTGKAPNIVVSDTAYRLLMETLLYNVNTVDAAAAGEQEKTSVVGQS
jgi:hypothetical protein